MTSKPCKWIALIRFPELDGSRCRQELLEFINMSGFFNALAGDVHHRTPRLKLSHRLLWSR